MATVWGQEIEKRRQIWAEVAKQNDWYHEPFYVQVWVNPTTGEITDSVASRELTQDVIVIDTDNEEED